MPKLDANDVAREKGPAGLAGVWLSCQFNDFDATRSNTAP